MTITKVSQDLSSIGIDIAKAFISTHLDVEDLTITKKQMVIINTRWCENEEDENELVIDQVTFRAAGSKKQYVLTIGQNGFYNFDEKGEK